MTPATPQQRAPRKSAHSHAQLAEALGWNTDQVARAVAAGILSPYDMKTPRWSGPLVDEMVARREELTAAIPDDLDDSELMALLGIGYGDFRRGRDAEVIPGPDRAPYWTRALAEELAGRAEQIRVAIPPQPLGLRRCAGLLAERTGLDVQDADVRTLHERGLTSVVDFYKKWDLYDVGALLALIGSEPGLATLPRSSPPAKPGSPTPSPARPPHSGSAGTCAIWSASPASET